MNSMKNRLKKCCHRSQAGNPVAALARAEYSVPGYRAMNRWITGSPRRPLAIATATRSSTRPMGSSHSRLNHLRRPTRIRGAMPFTCGTEPAHVAVLIWSSPGVSCHRQSRTVSGETLDGAGSRRSSGAGSASVSMA
jgi:hypothetical protein